MGEPEKAENTSTSSKLENANAAAREGRNPLANTNSNKFPKGWTDRVPRSGTIAFFAISPLEWGTKNRIKRAHMGSIPFILVTKMDA